jgi:hypothetical protein
MWRRYLQVIWRGVAWEVIPDLSPNCHARRRRTLVEIVLAELDVETIQQREGRWVLADLEGKRRRIHSVAISIWVKQGINAWMTAVGIEDSRRRDLVSFHRRLQRIDRIDLGHNHAPSPRNEAAEPPYLHPTCKGASVDAERTTIKRNKKTGRVALPRVQWVLLIQCHPDQNCQTIDRIDPGPT